MTLLPLAVMAVIAAEPFEQPSQSPPPPTPAEERAAARERYVERSHSELSFGYLGEWRDDTQRSWELASKDAPPSAAALTAPFVGRPFSGYRASGMSLESRTVWDGVRFTLGLRWPFASYRMADTTSSVDFGGSTHEIMVRSVSLFDFRTGLGYEVPFRVVTPFVDVLGDVENTSAALVIDGAPTQWKATGFSLGARAGVRIQVSQVFVMIAAEGTVLGAPRYGGALHAGVAF